MPDFVLTYRTPKDYARTTETSAAWYSWFEGMGDQLVELGRPVIERVALGESNPQRTELGGYSIVSAQDLEAAVAMAKGCPGLNVGGGVEVGQLGEVPARSESIA
jgi:hypothetical protein